MESLPGFEVVGEVHRGERAVEAVRVLQPDLLLLDVYLPDISGIEVLRRIRSNRGRSPTCWRSPRRGRSKPSGRPWPAESSTTWSNPSRWPPSASGWRSTAPTARNCCVAARTPPRRSSSGTSTGCCTPAVPASRRPSRTCPRGSRPAPWSRWPVRCAPPPTRTCPPARWPSGAASHGSAPAGTWSTWSAPAGRPSSPVRRHRATGERLPLGALAGARAADGLDAVPATLGGVARRLGLEDVALRGRHLVGRDRHPLQQRPDQHVEHSGSSRKPAVMSGLNSPACTIRRGRSTVDSTARATRCGEYTGGGAGRCCRSTTRPGHRSACPRRPAGRPTRRCRARPGSPAAGPGSGRAGPTSPSRSCRAAEWRCSPAAS
ncbi:response regulator [Blastococcus brunescens]|uniref:response regulator n=1 Tax=Blastococcus brunescens TaxID=1564165 RepID=UPI003BEEF016